MKLRSSWVLMMETLNPMQSMDDIFTYMNGGFLWVKCMKVDIPYG